MSKKTNILAVLGLAALSIFTLSTPLFAEDNLFNYQPSTENAQEPAGAVLGTYSIKVNEAALAEGFNLNLPDGKTLSTESANAAHESVQNGYGTRLYEGQIDGDSELHGNYSIAVTKGKNGEEGISGSIKTAGGEMYIIKQKEGLNSQELIKIDEDKQIECHGAAHSQNNFHEFQAKPSADIKPASATTINLLVAYTPDAAVTAGGTAAVESLIATMVSNANLAHSNSQTGVTYTLAGIYALSEGSNDNFSQELSAATNTTDGKWDELGTLREQYCADQVVVVVGGTNNQTICGIAWLGGDASTMSFYKAQMMAVVSANQTICSYLTFVHELGHNLGSDHDYGNSGQNAAYSYSYGYRFTGNSGQFRTVMAYSPGTRLPYFSNPRLSYDGSALGTSSADNSNSISLTSPVVGAFYADGDQCATSVTPPVLTAVPTSAPATQPDSVGVSARKSGSKVIFDSAAYLAGTPVSNVALALQSDRKANGTFSKVVKRGRTNASGIKSFKVQINSSSFFKVCYNGGASPICSGNIKVRVQRRR